MTIRWRTSFIMATTRASCGLIDTLCLYGFHESTYSAKFFFFSPDLLLLDRNNRETAAGKSISTSQESQEALNCANSRHVTASKLYQITYRYCTFYPSVTKMFQGPVLVQHETESLENSEVTLFLWQISTEIFSVAFCLCFSISLKSDPSELYISIQT